MPPEISTINLALAAAGRLPYEEQEAGVLVSLVLPPVSQRPQRRVARTISSFDAGGIACGALTGAATARCWKIDSAGAWLVMCVRDCAADLITVWLRAIARDMGAGLHPAARLSIARVPDLPETLRAQVSHADRLARAYAIEALRDPRLEQQAQHWGDRAKRMKAAATEPLIRALTAAAPLTPLPFGSRLAERLDPADCPLLFDVLGEHASAEDIQLLSGASALRLGLDASTRQQLLAAVS